MVDPFMTTMTFVFVDQENGHASKSVVTAESESDCIEKYFLKYPERLGDPRVKAYIGEADVSFSLRQRPTLDCKNCGHMAATHVDSPVPDDGHICLVEECDCRDYVAEEDE